MSHRLLSRRAALAALMFLLLSVAAPSQARPAAAPPAETPPALTPMRMVSSDEEQPRVDASPLLDRWRALGRPKGGPPLFDPQVLRKVEQDTARAQLSVPQAGASNSHVVSPASANVRPGGKHELTLGVSSNDVTSASVSSRDRHTVPPDFTGPVIGGSARRSSARPQTIGPQADAFNCTQELADPYVENIVGGTAVDWLTYRRKGYWTPDNPFSAPNALAMIERGSPVYNFLDNDDDVFSTQGTDLDAMGQAFSVPADAESITVQFKFRYDPGEIGAGDRLYYEFYYPNGNDIGNYIDGRYIDVAPYADGSYWTQTETFSDANFLNAVRNQQVVLVISTYNNNDGIYPVVRLDDIFAVVCEPGLITGKINQAGAATETTAVRGTAPQVGPSDLSDALVLLTYSVGGELQGLALTLPDAAGNYEFTGLPALAPSEEYQVIFLNYSLTDTIDDSRLSIWYGPTVTDFVANEYRVVPDFDITNVQLQTPDPYTEKVLTDQQPATFTWADRGLGDLYRFCIYDEETVEPGTDDPVQLCTVDLLGPDVTDVSIGRTSFPPDYAFRYGRQYNWYMRVYSPDTDGQYYQAGFSFYEHAITFFDSVQTPPDDPTTPDPNQPPSHSGGSWTVMIYIAGDNNLGDTQRTSNPQSNLQGQFASLKQLAAHFPNVNLVTLSDFYGNTGTQFCYLKPSGGPQCQELGEQDTSNPSVLANFVKQSLTLYPAQHTMLVIADHGHSIVGVAADETTQNQPSMPPDAVRQALDAANLSSKLDILFYDACLMGAFETAFDASSYAKYMVASSDLVWVLYAFDRVLPLLSSGNPAAVATGIVSAYGQAVDAVIPGVYRTMAAYDLSTAKVNALNTALSELGQALDDNLSTVRTNIAAIRQQVQVYDSSGNNLLDQIYDSSGVNISAAEEDAFVDLRHLATLLANSQLINNATINSKANAVLQALGPVGPTGFVIASDQHSGSNDEGATKNFANAHGLAVYFPNGERSGDQPTFSDSYLYRGAFAQYHATTQWDEFLRSYLSGVVGQGPGRVARGPGRVARGGRPVSGMTLSGQGKLFLPMVVR